MEFLVPADIGNRALQHCGAVLMDPTLGFKEISDRAAQVSFAYGKLRRAELRRNLWMFATRRVALRAVDTNTMLLAPALWGAGTTYFVGSIVNDINSNMWISRVPNNTGFQPGIVGSAFAWEPYYGPLTVMLYDSSTTYFAGEVVYTKAGDGTFNTYISLMSGNAVHPALPDQWNVNAVYMTNQVVQRFPNWSSGTTYSQGQGVLYTDGNVYVSLVNGNLNHIPPSSGAQWQLMTVLQLGSLTAPAQVPSLTLPQSSPIIEWAQGGVYSLGSFVMFNGLVYMSTANSNTGNFPTVSNWVQVSNGTLYMSTVDLNWGNDPATDAAHWTSSFTQGGGNPLWRQIGGAAFPAGVFLSEFTSNIVYPIGSGPVSQASTRNVYRLPFGYLRKAPRDPKAGSVSYLGAPTNLTMNDWVEENNFIVTRQSTPIILRFVADVQDVTIMDDQFCEALAAKIAEAVVEPLTQSTAKLANIKQTYREAIYQAGLVNAIELGADEPELDDWLATRL